MRHTWLQTEFNLPPPGDAHLPVFPSGCKVILVLLESSIADFPIQSAEGAVLENFGQIFENFVRKMQLKSSNSYRLKDIDKKLKWGILKHILVLRYFLNHVIGTKRKKLG